MADTVTAASTALCELSRWIDAANVHRDPEAVTWGRLAKVSEESGEVIAAYIAATGQNPRKGVTGDQDDVIAELLDVAVTALGAVEHLTGHNGEALPSLLSKIHRVRRRALSPEVAPSAPPKRFLITEPHDGHPSTGACPGCPHEEAPGA